MTRHPFELSMPHWPKPNGLEPLGAPSVRTRELLSKLGHPERQLPLVIHVGGTKGKGSTIAFMRAMLEAAGYRVHCYTSPHLARFNERIVLAGQEIDDDLLYRVLEETRLAAGAMPVGFFDATTAAAMLAFSRIPADILLMEMGLGGAVDATNLLEQPALTVMTTISYDHMEVMGNHLTEIAAFEAGLLKAGVPCIVGYQDESVMQVLRERAAMLKVPLYEYGTHWKSQRAEDGMLFADAHGTVALPAPALLGVHQIVNAGLAIAALSALDSVDIGADAIVHGLEHAVWKGRLQKLPATLIPAGSECWFDGGHNEAAGEAIALFAKEYWADWPLYIIFGTTKGKDSAAILRPFVGIAKQVLAVSVQSEPNSYSPEMLVHALSPIIAVESAESVDDALQAIMAKEARPFRALVFGSLYLWLEATQLP